MMNDEFRVPLSSGNGAGRRSALRAVNARERRQNLKYAVFYLVVAALLFLSNQFAKHERREENQSNTALNVAVDLSVGRKSPATTTGRYSANQATYIIRFRVTNRGNRSVFYPVYPGTNRPIGHIVYRVAPGSEWMVLPRPEEPISPPALRVEGGVAWVEMPPGGSVDGVYDDPGSPGGDHAYELDLKAATNEKITRFFSQTYRLNTN
jgi:hypothetical protein